MEGFTIQSNIQNVIDGLKKEKQLSKKVIERTVGDMRKLGPGWVSKVVREEYNISATDVRNAVHTKSAGQISFNGISVDDVALVYKGRVLTPTHFKMKPGSRPASGAPYKITAEIKKGSRERLSSIAFLAHAGGAGTKEIPFKRTGKERLPIKAIKTVSIPQMVQDGDGNIKPKIEKTINENLEKRFNHHVERLLNKK